jgi:thymidine phosphorylase
MPNGIAKSLAGVPLGASAIVRRVASARSIARRLMELGLVPGTRDRTQQNEGNFAHHGAVTFAFCVTVVLDDG